MTKDQATKIKHELELIRRSAPDGLLRPEAVVRFARAPTTELHRHFEWDDSAAAEAYRLTQARQILRVQVTMLDVGDGEETSVRAYVSFSPPERGYTETIDVLSTKRGRRDLILKILGRISALAQSYRLPELAPITRAIEQVQTSLVVRRTKGSTTARRSSSRDRDSRIPL
jgi:hypothetical protein